MELNFSLPITYLITRISNAVVWGGMLLVIKEAWRTCTRKPGLSLEKDIGRPNISHIRMFLGTLNLMTEEGFLSLIVVKLLFWWSMLKILPTVTFSEKNVSIKIPAMLYFYYMMLKVKCVFTNKSLF